MHILPIITFIFLIVVIASVFGLTTDNIDALYVVAPIVTTFLIVILFWHTLHHRRGQLPLADLGTFTVLAICIYTTIPPIQFLISGMKFTINSALPLYDYSPTPQEFGEFTWWYVVYLLCFVISYLATDSRNSILEEKPTKPNQSTVNILILVVILLTIATYSLDYWYGINQNVTYGTDEMLSSYDTLLKMPALFRQIYGVITSNGIFFIAKLSILIVIFINWENRFSRNILFVWLFIMLISNILWMGARTELVLTFLAVAIMYHQFVKKLTLKQILPLGGGIFLVFMIMGFMRGSATLSGNISFLRTIISDIDQVASINTEFQSLFGGNYDLLQMVKKGNLGEIPVQFTLYDLIMIVPQQILPFEKLNVQNWYVSLSHSSGYFMFNPIGQAIIGFGWLELILRGLILGFAFAKIRIWYVKRSSSFWVTLFYFYLIIISYYTIRSTAIYIVLVSILYRFIPFYLLIRFISIRKSVAPSILQRY